MLELILIAVALAMDCFTVSVVAGIITGRRDDATMVRLAVLFGLFQALMPLIGWFLTSRFSSYIEAFDHWIAFGMLAFIGGKMVFDAFREDETKAFNPRDFRTQIVLAVATSIDAMAVGISFACTGYDSLARLCLPLVLIGLVSFVFSIAGFCLGVRFGDAVTRKINPELLGGIILVAIGVKILIEHL